MDERFKPITVAKANGGTAGVTFKRLRRRVRHPSFHRHDHAHEFGGDAQAFSARPTRVVRRLAQPEERVFFQALRVAFEGSVPDVLGKITADFGAQVEKHPALVNAAALTRFVTFLPVLLSGSFDGGEIGSSSEGNLTIAHSQVHRRNILEMPSDAGHRNLGTHCAVKVALAGLARIKPSDLRIMSLDRVPITGASGEKPQAIETAHGWFLAAPHLPITVPTARLVKGVQLATRRVIGRKESFRSPRRAPDVLEFRPHVVSR